MIPVHPEVPTVVPQPDVWSEPEEGTPWCDCGDEHSLDRDVLAAMFEQAYGPVGERITHLRVIELAAYAWRYVSVCAFFTGRVADAATEVNGAVAEDYPFEIGLAIVKRFSDTWHGCPDEGCQGDFVPSWVDD